MMTRRNDADSQITVLPPQKRSKVGKRRSQHTDVLGMQKIKAEGGKDLSMGGYFSTGQGLEGTASTVHRTPEDVNNP